MIVLDASAAVDLILRIQPQADAIRDRIDRPGETLHAPHLLDAEVVQALRRRVRRRVTDLARAEEAIVDLRVMRLVRYPLLRLLGRMWELRDSLSAYDAAYVALAESLDASVVSTDAGLARTRGHGARVELMA